MFPYDANLIASKKASNILNFLPSTSYLLIMLSATRIPSAAALMMPPA